MTVFPDAEYLILSSRLIPDHDGGFTLATLARARQMAAAGVAGGAGPLLLTVDPGDPRDHARHRAAFVERDLLIRQDRMRNLFDEASGPEGGAADWLRRAAHPGDADPALQYRVIADAHGRPSVGLPVIAGDPDWHLSAAPVVVYDASGSPAGVIDGFGALYRAWVDEVVRERRADRDRSVVLLCESRQLGELFAGWDDPDARLIHTIHTIHLEPPHSADAGVNALWSRWFDLAERFDAVLWPTTAQRDAVVERFRIEGVHLVVPHGVDAASSVAPSSERDRGRVVMLNRLAPGKRVDAAIRAFAAILADIPDAALDIYGDGPLRSELQHLIDDLGVGARVVLRGATDDPRRVLDSAWAYLSTSAYEGQGLAIAEALGHGCPVVAYDAPYGPGEALASGGGILVPDGDEDALVAALRRILLDVEDHARLAAEAVIAARLVDPDRVMSALAAAARDVLARPARR